MKKKLLFKKREPILEIGMMVFKDGDQIPYRRTKKYGYQWFNEDTKRWGKMTINFDGLILK